MFEYDTELAEFEALNKGYRGDVTVKIGDKSYKVYVTTMIRLQQDLHEALVPLQKCDVLIENIKKNKGKYFYYKGNIYRDLDDIAGATYYYSKAFDELSYELALQEYFDGFVIVAL